MRCNPLSTDMVQRCYAHVEPQHVRVREVDGALRCHAPAARVHCQHPSVLRSEMRMPSARKGAASWRNMCGPTWACRG
eukprot:4065060-Prymnesium_polylepis.2